MGEFLDATQVVSMQALTNGGKPRFTTVAQERMWISDMQLFRKCLKSGGG